MKYRYNIFSFSLLAVIVLLFFVGKIYGVFIAGSILIAIFIFEKKLFKMFTKLGFLIFILIALGTPLLVDFSMSKLLSNLLIVLRGILIFIWLYFYTKNISSSRVYQLVKRLLPSELISTIKLSFVIIPTMQKETVNTARRIKKKEISFRESIGCFLSQTLQIAESHANDPIHQKKKIYILTGKIHEGKTTQLEKIINQAKKDKLKVGGIIAKYKEGPNEAREYHVVDLKTNESKKLITTEPTNNYHSRFFSYYFLKDGMELALKAISLENLEDVDVAVIDEIGAIELESRGYAQKITPLVESNVPTLIFVVRDTFVEQICKKFKIDPTEIIKVENKCIPKFILPNLQV